MAEETMGMGMAVKSPKQLWSEKITGAAMLFLLGWGIAGAMPTFLLLKFWGFVPGLIAACVALGFLIMALAYFRISRLQEKGIRLNYYDD